MKPSSHLALARKYRPQQFEDVVGQDAVSTTLKNAVSSAQVAHAYLFYGPRGVGKTTSARLLAKALNCAKGPTPNPCGTCASCVDIAAGSGIDVLELDAASHTQVEKIREMIIETVALAPARDRRKIFIIDEVHMLSNSSFNALLKTLEEPPPHVVFILATTELAKIPATIVSRCQRFRFRAMTPELMAVALERIAKAEKVRVEPEALALIARAAGGALRDAISLLDQALAFSDGKVTAASVAELLGALPEEILLGVAQAVLAKDAAALASWLARVDAEGFDPAQLLRDFRERLQALYRRALGVGEAPEGWGALADQPAEAYSFLVKRVNKTLEDLRSADSPQSAFELGVYGLLESAYDLRGWVQRLEALERRLSGASGAAPVPVVPPPAVRPAPLAPPTAPRPAAAPSPAPAQASADPAAAWAALLAELEADKPALALALGAAAMTVTGKEWRLAFKTNFEAERAAKDKTVVEDRLRAAGAAVSLLFETRAAEGAAGWVDAAEVDAASDDPAVKKAIRIFGGRVRQTKKKP